MWLAVRALSALLAVSALAAGCSADTAREEPAPTSDQAPAPNSDQTPTPTEATPPEVSVTVGAEVLADEGFARLAGRRVGVILNQASTVRGEPLLDVLARAPEVDLVAAFGPEHGVRGTAPAGAAVADAVDPATGVEVFSLYGDTRAPTPEMLVDIDVLVFDLQDVGARMYTYVSTMGLAMQAAAEAGIPFVVLDRPNPLGGHYLDGFVRRADQASFVGQYPIPIAHGLTAGELALAIEGEGWLPGLEALELEVVALQGWERDDRWGRPPLDWVPPSPSLPTLAAAEVYAGTVLFEATSMSVGRGTDEPFTVVGAPWVDAASLVAELEGLALPGVTFEAVSFVPEASESVPSPPHEGQVAEGVRVRPIGERFQPVAVGIHLLVSLARHADERGAGPFLTDPALLDLLAGTDALRRQLTAGESAEGIIEAWSADVVGFDELRRPYLLYP